MAPPFICNLRSNSKMSSVASFRRDVEVTTNRGPVYGIDNKNLYLYEIFRYYILLLEDHRVQATIPKSVILNKLGLEETARIFLLRSKLSIRSSIHHTENPTALSFVQEYQDEPSTVPSWSLKWPDTIKVLTEYTKLALLPAVKQGTQELTSCGRIILSNHHHS